jgi:hypothetical protein
METLTSLTFCNVSGDIVKGTLVGLLLSEGSWNEQIHALPKLAIKNMKN